MVMLRHIVAMDLVSTNESMQVSAFLGENHDDNNQYLEASLNMESNHKNSKTFL